MYKLFVDLDAKCVRCGEGGAVSSIKGKTGKVCMGCMAKAVKNGELDNIIKPSTNKPRKN